MAMAGTFVGDRKGHITGGELDLNDAGRITHVPGPLTGTFTTSSSFNGVLRGTVTITSFQLPGTTVNLRLKFVLSADSTQGRIIQFDDSGFTNSGTLHLQDPSALLEANPVGNYAFGLDSDAPVGARIVNAGQFVMVNRLQRGPSGGISGGLIDQSNACAPAPAYCTAPITTGAATGPDPSGRGTLTLTVGGTATQYVFYTVDEGHLYLMEIDTGSNRSTVLAGVARAQSAFDPTSPNTTSVLQLTGLDAAQGGQTAGSDVIIGAMSISGENAFSFNFDSNDAGSILTAQHVAGMVLSFDPATGRGVISVGGGFSGGFVDTAIFYLYDSGEGFLIDADPVGNNGAVNKALSGTFVLQANGPFNTQSVSGLMIVGTGTSPITAVPNAEGAADFDSTNSTFAVIGDLTALSRANGNLSDGSFDSTYQVTDGGTGRGTATVSAALFGDFTQGLQDPASLYLIAPNRFVLIGTRPGSNSGVTFFDPELVAQR